MKGQGSKAQQSSALDRAFEGDTNGLYFVPLGGSGEIGMNLNLYAYRDQWLMLDCGVTFGDEEHAGVDVIMPDPAFIVERRDKLLGIVATHAHEDHIGAIPYLWPQLQCPIWATPFTASLLKAKLAEVGLADRVEITIVPPGRVTRAISRSAATGSGMCSMMSATLTALKALSENGRLVTSAVRKRQFE